MTRFWVFVADSIFCSINVWMYAKYHYAFSLGAAVFCGFMALAIMLWRY